MSWTFCSIPVDKNSIGNYGNYGNMGRQNLLNTSVLFPVGKEDLWKMERPAKVLTLAMLVSFL